MASYKPTEKNQYDARVAKADAAYKVAKEKCDDLKGNDKDVCVKEAKAKLAKAKADAKVAKAQNVAVEKTTAASIATTNGSATAAKPTEKVIDAKRNANDDKRDADYNGRQGEVRRDGRPGQGQLRGRCQAEVRQVSQSIGVVPERIKAGAGACWAPFFVPLACV